MGVTRLAAGAGLRAAGRGLLVARSRWRGCRLPDLQSRRLPGLGGRPTVPRRALWTTSLGRPLVRRGGGVGARLRVSAPLTDGAPGSRGERGAGVPNPAGNAGFGQGEPVSLNVRAETTNFKLYAF